MPIYDFCCPDCLEYWELTYKMDDIEDAMPTCPNCMVTMDRVFSPVSIKVTDGTTPQRFSGGKSATGTRRVEDAGFNREYEAIWKDSGMEHPEPTVKDPEWEKRRADANERMLGHSKELKKTGKGGLSGNLRRLKDEGKG